VARGGEGPSSLSRSKPSRAHPMGLVGVCDNRPRFGPLRVHDVGRQMRRGVAGRTGKPNERAERSTEERSTLVFALKHEHAIVVMHTWIH